MMQVTFLHCQECEKYYSTMWEDEYTLTSKDMVEYVCTTCALHENNNIISEIFIDEYRERI